MNGVPITQKEVQTIRHLRQTGHSLPEIMRMVKRGSSTVSKYIQDVQILPEFVDILKVKQGGSKKRAEIAWNNAELRASELIPRFLTFDQQLFLLIGIYWGEGNKKDLNLINSDPGIIKIFIKCMLNWGVQMEQFKIGLRLHDNADRSAAISFWAGFLGISRESIKGVEIIKRGDKVGKLKYGMCRVRVAKSAPYFKLLMSLIAQVKYNYNAAVVQRIEQGTPKP